MYRVSRSSPFWARWQSKDGSCSGRRRRYLDFVTKRTAVEREPEPTHYANVDLDVYAGVRLDGFVQALGDEAHREVWESAQRREFNIGIEAGLSPHSFELQLRQQTLEAIDDVRGVLVITVYAPDLRGALPVTGRRTKK